MTTLALVGAGHIGSQIARLGVARGYDVVVSNSRGPETLGELVAELGPSARAATVEEAARAGDIVVVTIPFRSIESLPADAFAGKVVVDTNNYYPQRDGHVAELDDESTTVSELLQRHLPDAHVVKAFNHIYSSAIVTDALPSGDPERRALAIAGDDAEAKAAVTALLDDFGFDAVDLGPLSEGWRVQRETPAYGPRLTAPELRRAAADAKRYRDMR
ncbi:NAD(P)-binding domain-containing protein [Leifsonia poae]|uniref:NADP oxidoreductase n=2 Tax=Leifsonia poae TaxID=110933 RepID=A0A9W6M0D9_9MICO|nr:NADP oxidoreductase [Leifsonia poae]